MIAQMWCGRTRADDRHDFAILLQARIQAELAASKACRGAYVLQRQIAGGEAESLVLTLYDHGSLVSSPREDNALPSSLSEKEARLLLGRDPTSTRYDVIVEPRRALLYAALRGRFPLRIAAPR